MTAALVAMTIFAPAAQAQGFLGKALKAIDKAAAKVEETVGNASNAVDGAIGNPSELPSKTAGYETAKVKSFSTSVDFEIESCIFDGTMLIIDYSLTNRGKEIKLFRFGGRKHGLYLPNTDTKFYDDLGNVYDLTFISAGNTWSVEITGSQTVDVEGVAFALPEGVKVKGRIEINKFNSRAKSLKLATIAGCFLDETKTLNSGKYTPFGVITLKNVPIYSSTAVLNKPKTLFAKENPTVANQSVGGNTCVIKSVVITEENTQVNFYYKGNYIIYTGDVNNVYISAGGKRYDFLTSYGIPTHKSNYCYGSEHTFTLVFDKIPENTASINLQFDDWSFTGVTLREPESINIPKTGSVMSDYDKLPKFDAKYKTPLTAAEIASWQLNKAEPVVAPMKVFFGKEIYKDDNDNGSNSVALLDAVANALRQDNNYTLFAAALTSVKTADATDGFTVFALPDSIITLDDEAMPADEVQWHVVRGKYTAAQLLAAQTLTTIGGQTLTVATETIDADGEQQTVLYVNDVPVDYQGVRLLGETPTYAIGTNIAKISNPPSPEDIEKYKKWAAIFMDGVWQISAIEYRHYYDYYTSNGTERIEDTDYFYEDNSHSFCREVFTRNNKYANKGMAGKYESLHYCEDGSLKYNPYPGITHQQKGWWEVKANGTTVSIYFRYNSGTDASPNFNYGNDYFSFEKNNELWILHHEIEHITGRGYDLGGGNVANSPSATLRASAGSNPVAEYFEVKYRLKKVVHF